MSLNVQNLKEFYEHVFPLDDLIAWLSYGSQFSCNTKSYGISTTISQDGNFPTLLKEEQPDAAIPSEEKSSLTTSVRQLKVNDNVNLIVEQCAYLSHREFSFTLFGDIYVRFKSYSNARELQHALLQFYPIKIDIGAVYNTRPNTKTISSTQLLPVERELIFDIDMSDYDDVRVCCQGKSVCSFCWLWIACAALTLRFFLTEAFGFSYILPVFSGRRGIHIWVCDKRARRLEDTARASLVSYISIFRGHHKTAVNYGIVSGRSIHPDLHHIQKMVLESFFQKIYLLSDPQENPNSIRNPKGAKVIYDAICAALENSTRGFLLQKFKREISYEEGDILDWNAVLRVLGDASESVFSGVQFMLLYPRLDEHVSTTQNHLLKLPFCIHPNTNQLCCPLSWDDMLNFNPAVDAPTLDSLLLTRSIPEVFLIPLRTMVTAMNEDSMEYNI